MILRLMLPYHSEGKPVNFDKRADAMDLAIAELAAEYKMCRKWDYECKIPTPSSKDKYETVKASVLEVIGKDRTAFDATAKKAREAIGVPVYIETADNRIGTSL